MSKYHEISVAYSIKNEDYERLKKCAEEYERKGYEKITPEEVFKMGMLVFNSTDEAINFVEANSRGVPVKEGVSA